MRHLIILFLLVVFSVSVKAQESYLHQTLDTLKSSYRTGGKTLDSVDLIYSEKFSSTPASFLTHPFGKFGNDYLGFFQSLSFQHRILPSVQFKYAALPHLGMYYAFGSKGTQYLVVNYNQNFSSKVYFTLGIQRNVSTGAYRYNAFQQNLFSLGLLYKGNRWGHLMTFSSEKQNRNLNGGIVSFDEVEQFGLDYAKVHKQNSSDSISVLNLSTESAWNIFKKDTLKRFSLVLKNSLIIDKRVFIEKDSLMDWYPTQILFDSTNTRDLSQLSRLDNQFGVRFNKNKFRSEIFIDRGYWKYKTYSYQYKNELDILANFILKGESWNVRSDNQFNLVGANNQSKFNFVLVKKNKNIDVKIALLQSSLLPTPMQRVYITNTLNYITTNLQLQQTKSATIELKTNSKQALSVSAYVGEFSNHYFFLNDQWRNDTLQSISQLTLNAKGDFSLGAFHLQPNLTVSFVDKVQLLPKYDLRTRMFLSLNAKRPGTIFNVGVDVNYKSTYQLMTFDDRISLYQLNFKNGFYKDYWMLDVFTSMQLDEFRMYFKIENLDSFWTSPSNSIAKNYPIVPMVMRLGLTWDFFN